MYLNWQWIAPKIRVATEQYNSLTFSSFFESRFGDTSGLIRVFSALILVVFYTIYISAALTGHGRSSDVSFQPPLRHRDFNRHRHCCSLCLYRADIKRWLGSISFKDSFYSESLFLFLSICSAVSEDFMGSPTALPCTTSAKSLIPDFSSKTLITIISMALGWGLGYFGQPHIVTKFMGIKKVSEIHKSKWLGMSWMTCH